MRFYPIRTETLIWRDCCDNFNNTETRFHRNLRNIQFQMHRYDDELFNIKYYKILLYIILYKKIIFVLYSLNAAVCSMCVCTCGLTTIHLFYKGLFSIIRYILMMTE